MGSIARGWELVDTKVVEQTDGGNGTKTTSWVETTIRRAVEGTNARKGESAVLGTVDQAEEDEGKQSINGSNLHAVGMFPLYGNRVRFLLSDGTLAEEEFAARKVKTPTKEYFEKLLDETVTPHKVKILSYNWLTYYRANERRAAEFVHKQRIFLAGDAAHCHSPMGGQGLNTGLQDSYNLAWKIAMVLKGIAPLSIVDSYSAERIPIADEIIHLSAKNLVLFVSENYFFYQVRKYGLTLLSYILPYLPTGVGGPTFAMLGLRYYENSVNKEHISQRYASTSPASIGSRAPDDFVYPLTTDSTPVRLYNLMDTLCAFHILVFAADHLVQDKSLKNTLFANVEHYQGSWLTRWPGTRASTANGVKEMKATSQFMVHVISHHGLDATTVGDNYLRKESGYGRMYLDSEGGDLHKRYGITAKGGIVVVRPDTHISYRVETFGKAAWEDVDGYFRSTLFIS
ncbi:hypothetical protein BGZ97_000684 [Linnemannia gamsii]|uniref:FAD-binding domain-containing protein n=1 Tax=Linnemannia gamsii TaxID=64522 RepID=A0A9P6QXT3_9FUNG|nr:hypothetical protein BGZ97_000684 [Linnemannia gamsii]